MEQWHTRLQYCKLQIILVTEAKQLRFRCLCALRVLCLRKALLPILPGQSLAGSAWYSPAQFRNTLAQISPTYSSHLANTPNQLLGLRLFSSNKQAFLERSPRERSCYISESARLERRLTRGLTREGSRNVYLHQPCFACLTIKRLSIQKTMLVINKFPAQNGSLASSRPRVVKNRVGPTLFLTTSKNLDKGDIRAR